MKKHILWLLVFVGPSLWSQVQKLSVQQLKFPIELRIQNNAFALESGAEQSVKKTANTLMLPEGLSLVDGDLVLNYRLSKTEKNFFYELHPYVEDTAGNIHYPGAVDLRGDFNNINNVQSAPKQLIWGDVIESFLDLGQRYTLWVTAELWGDPGVNCELGRPVFSLGKQLPYYAGAVVGLGFVGVGQISKSQSDDDYDEYRRLWESNQSKEAADSFLASAQDNSDQYETLRNIGLAVLAVDAILYFRQLLAIKKRQKRYDRYCRNQELKDLSIRPFYQLPEQDLAVEQYGLSLTIKF